MPMPLPYEARGNWCPSGPGRVGPDLSSMLPWIHIAARTAWAELMCDHDRTRSAERVGQ